MSEKEDNKQYYEILEKASVNQHLHIFSYTGSQSLVKETGHIFADRLYWQELLPYVCEYGYEAINSFCLVFASKIKTKKNE